MNVNKNALNALLENVEFAEALSQQLKECGSMSRGDTVTSIEEMMSWMINAEEDSTDMVVTIVEAFRGTVSFIRMAKLYVDMKHKEVILPMAEESLKANEDLIMMAIMDQSNQGHTAFQIVVSGKGPRVGVKLTTRPIADSEMDRRATTFRSSVVTTGWADFAGLRVIVRRMMQECIQKMHWACS